MPFKRKSLLLIPRKKARHENLSFNLEKPRCVHYPNKKGYINVENNGGMGGGAEDTTVSRQFQSRQQSGVWWEDGDEELSARGKFTHIYRTKQRFVFLIHIPSQKYDSVLPWQLSNLNGEVLLPPNARLHHSHPCDDDEKESQGKTSQVPLGWKIFAFWFERERKEI